MINNFLGIDDWGLHNKNGSRKKYAAHQCRQKFSNCSTKIIKLLSSNCKIFNPNLPDHLNFNPFGTMRYSSFAFNSINIHKYNLHMTCICLFLNEALDIPLSTDIWLASIYNYLTSCHQIHIFNIENPQNGLGKLGLIPFAYFQEKLFCTCSKTV